MMPAMRSQTVPQMCHDETPPSEEERFGMWLIGMMLERAAKDVWDRRKISRLKMPFDRKKLMEDDADDAMDFLLVRFWEGWWFPQISKHVPWIAPAKRPAWIAWFVRRVGRGDNVVTKELKG